MMAPLLTRRPPAPIVRPSTAAETAQTILAADAIGLRERERDFLLRMSAWRGGATERQAPWLDELWARHVRVMERAAS